MRRRAFVGMTALMPVGAAFGQTGDMRSFRTQVLALFRQKFPDIPVTPGKDDGSIDIETTTVNLGNIYARVRSMTAEQRKAAIIDFLDRAVESHKLAQAERTPSWSEAKKLLRPRLSSVEPLREVPSLLTQEYAPGVVVAYVLDLGQTLRYVDRSDCEKWGLERPFDLHIVNDWAITNLEQLSAVVPIKPKRLSGHSGKFTAIEEDDTYDAARLLLPKFRTRLLSVLGQRIFVGIPCRDRLVACSADFTALSAFVGMVVEDYRQQPYPITDTVFLVTNSGLVRPATAKELAGR
jgi:uncharacterized protein YtpQ (UPF0354 family)